MSNPLLSFFAISVMLLHGLGVHAQQKGYTFEVVVSEQWEKTDGNMIIFPQRLPGAVISIISPSDTLVATTDDSGRCLFRKIADRYIQVRVQHMGYKDWTRECDADTLKFLEVRLDKDMKQLEAAVVKENVPVFEYIGDTLKYNVASVQQVADDDMLRDVMERLPGVSVSAGGVKVMEEEVSKIYTDGKLVFGDNVSAPLNYLAGSDVVSVKVYDQASREERLGVAQEGRKKEKVINVETRSKLKTAVVSQVSAGYGRNFEKTGTESDNRYVSGLSGNWFSEKTLLSVNAYLNNVGASNDYSAVTRTSQVPSSYSRLGYAGAKLVKKFGDSTLGESLSASYSYGNRKDLSESSLDRVYSPDENWVSRTYIQNSRSESRRGTHEIRANYNSALPYIPEARLSFSVSDMNRLSASGMSNEINGFCDGYDQKYMESSRDYAYSVNLNKMFKVGKFYFNAMALVNGGRSSGTALQRDSTLASSSVTSFVSEPVGENISADALLSASRSIWDKLSLTASLHYMRNKSSVNKLRYRDAVSEANLDTLTSNIHTYDYDTYEATVGLDWLGAMEGLVITSSVRLRYDLQRRQEEVPMLSQHKVKYLSVAPTLNLSYRKRGSSISLSFISNPVLPAHEQIRRDFNADNPLFIYRGNPELKKATDYSLMLMSSSMLKNIHSLSFSFNARYLADKIVNSSKFFTDGTDIDGYAIQPGATFVTYDNVDGTMSCGARLGWSTRIRLLKSNFSADAGYDFSRDPSYIEGQMNVAYRHRPDLNLRLTTNFSRNYELEVRSNTSYSTVNNSICQGASYLDQTASVRSKNKITDWMFINADYEYLMRHPFKGVGKPLHNHRLNAIMGFRLAKSGVEINLSCYDILNRVSSFKTTVVDNYTQTSFTPNLGRIYLVTVLWRFNSTQKGTQVRFGRAPLVGQDFEKNIF